MVVILTPIVLMVVGIPGMAPLDSHETNGSGDEISQKILDLARPSLREGVEPRISRPPNRVERTNQPDVYSPRYFLLVFYTH